MATLTWDKTGEHFYETGLDKGVLYVQDAGAYPKGVAWNGLTGVTESPSGADATDLYADNQKYLSLRAAETFGATIEAYTYPDEFAACDGSSELAKGLKIGQQTRKTFGFAYRTKLGNDTDGDDHGYIIHLVYGATASPSSKSRATINESPEAITFSWEISTTPVNVTGYKPTATVEIDSTKITADALKKIEEALYGTTEKEAYLPLPEELTTLAGAASVSEEVTD
jgi:hypothetical protein